MKMKKLKPRAPIAPLPPDIKNKIQNILNNSTAVEKVQDAWATYQNFQQQDYIPRGELNKSLLELKDHIDKTQSLLAREAINEAASLCAFGTVPSKQLMKFQSILSTISKGLNTIPKPRKGRPTGGTASNRGTNADILFDSLCKACQIAGYSTDDGLRPKVKELAVALGVDQERKRLDAINRLSKKHKKGK